ncbi:unnamed protein product [Arctogadus glacialis]
MALNSLNAALDEAERVEAVMIPCKRPGPQVCRADVSDEEGNVEGRVVFQARTLGRLPPVQPTIDPIENNDKIGRVGHANGLYLLCSIKGHPCWALVDTGSTISIVCPGVLPETGWTPTD